MKFLGASDIRGESSVKMSYSMNVKYKYLLLNFPKPTNNCLKIQRDKEHNSELQDTTVDLRKKQRRL